MLKINSYSNKGTKLTATVSLPKEWEAKPNSYLLAQAIHVYRDRSHFGLAKSQTRAEVNRTTKKLYKQKGTGGARHGSRKAPIFVGGGVAHGPRPVSRELTLSTALKRKALGVAMSYAVKEERVIAGEMDFKKTNEVQKFIDKVAEKKNRKVTFIINKENLKVTKFIRNIKNIKIIVFPGLNAFDIFFGGTIILDKSIFKAEKKTGKEKS